MFADSTAFMCFYDVEHMLSAIIKFLLHLLWKGRGWLDGREEVGEESGEGTARV